MNTQLSILLNQLIKDKFITVDAITEILHQSKDSVYRRLRGETDFLLNEAFILANKFSISIDALNNESTEQKIFKTKQIVIKDDAITTIKYYIDDLYNDMQKLHQVGIQNLYYAAKDLPLFCFFSSPLLTSFKLYFWNITLFNAVEKRKPFEENWLTSDIVNQANELYKLYTHTNTVEIWNFETINSTLHQILYCLDIGLINLKQATKLMDTMDAFVENLDENVKQSSKQNIGKLKMYLNEILLLDNSVIFDLGFQKIFYLPYQTLNFLSSTDENFAQQNLDWFQKQIAKSTIISGDGEKTRTKLMNHYRKEIGRYRSKIGED